MQFTQFDLHPRLHDAIQSAGYTTPTPIQVQAIPLGLAGQDLIGTAQTGTGKTAAFVLPILQRLLADPSKLGTARALIITPTRELAEQINTMIRQFSQGTAIRSATIYGGVGMPAQERALRTGVEIIVACPGRLLDHIERGATLKNIEVLVLDEADRLLDMGFLPAVKRIISNIPRQRQTLMFSATFAPELQQLAGQALRQPQRVDAGHGAPVKTVAHALYPVHQHLKTPLLIHLLRETDTNSVLIFTRTKHRANRVAEQMKRAGFDTGVLHSNKSQNQRQSALDNFRSGKVPILVATDIAARGLDIDTVSHVINYDMPDTADTYIHRIGRTGRAEREGDALTLMTNDDLVTCRDIERALKSPIERRTIANFDYSQPAPDRNEFQRPPLQRNQPARGPRTDARSSSQGPRPGLRPNMQDNRGPGQPPRVHGAGGPSNDRSARGPKPARRTS
ncbi:MAG: DEAD/DEAH box helicase [Herpetosiphon sp.]